VTVTASTLIAKKTGKAEHPNSNFPTNTTVGGKAIDSVHMTSSTSNIKTVINTQQPEIMEFTIQANSNPQGPIVRNVLDKDARLNVTVSVDLPFNGWAGEVEVADTSPMKMNLEGAEDHIEWIVFRVEADNGIPLEAFFQGYFADSAGNLLDSIFSPYRVFAVGATIDANGDVVTPTHDVYEVRYEKDRIKRILSTKQFILKVGLTSTKFNSTLTPVRITTAQRFKMKLGVHIQFSADEKL
jgi:hypothetical protein